MIVNWLYHQFLAHKMDNSAYLESSIKVQSVEDVDLLLARVVASATQVRQWITAFDGEPLDFLRRLKFEAVGYHPIAHHPLNVIEQVNQTWTYAVALLAARRLFQLHPDAGGYHLAPGAHASQPLDVMSEVEGLVGAETFAAVTPRNNNKLFKDLSKLSSRPETNRYVFFMSPRFPGNTRLPQFERNGVQVWSVDF